MESHYRRTGRRTPYRTVVPATLRYIAAFFAVNFLQSADGGARSGRFPSRAACPSSTRAAMGPSRVPADRRNGPTAPGRALSSEMLSPVCSFDHPRRGGTLSFSGVILRTNRQRVEQECLSPGKALDASRHHRETTTPHRCATPMQPHHLKCRGSTAPHIAAPPRSSPISSTGVWRRC